jgi:hypothetical protein
VCCGTDGYPCEEGFEPFGCLSTSATCETCGSEFEKCCVSSDPCKQGLTCQEDTFTFGRAPWPLTCFDCGKPGKRICNGLVSLTPSPYTCLFYACLVAFSIFCSVLAPPAAVQPMFYSAVQTWAIFGIWFVQKSLSRREKTKCCNAIDSVENLVLRG